MKLGAVTKLDKRNAAMSKSFDDDVVSGNYNFIFSFPIYGQFSEIRKLDSQVMVSIKLTFKLTMTFYLSETENRTKKSLTQLSNYWSE